MRKLSVLLIFILLLAFCKIYSSNKVDSSDERLLLYLEKTIGDLGQMHIVEFGADGQILKKISKFASFTVVDTADRLATLKKYLEPLGLKNVHFVDCKELEDLHAKKIDLCLCQTTFFSWDNSLKMRWLQQIASIPQGYMKIDCATKDCALIDEIILDLSRHQRKGVFKKERRNCDSQDYILFWNPDRIKKSVLSCKRDTSLGNGITYGMSGGRLGDNLLAYFHAKWLALKYGLPLYYKPFPLANQFYLFENDLPLNKATFKKKVVVTQESDIDVTAKDTLFVVPYFPDEVEFEYRKKRKCRAPRFTIEWRDPEFLPVVKRALTAKKNVILPPLAADGIRVGVHVRRGSPNTTQDDPVLRAVMPAKFPPDSYYIEQLKRIIKFFPGQKIRATIFTDSPNPKALVEKFRQAIIHSDLTIEGSKTNNTENPIADFLLLMHFDCLIIPQSNFSQIASKAGDYALVISAMDRAKGQQPIYIDNIKIEFNGSHF